MGQIFGTKLKVKETQSPASNISPSHAKTKKNKQTEPWKISIGRNILSPSETFVLGFFKPSSTSGVVERWYLGIWDHRFPQEVVWVANRDSPLSKPIGTLEILDNNLVLLDQHGTRVWWTNGTITSLMKPQLVGELLDSGNLVLRYSNKDSSAGYLWQSFDFPTDALLSGMKLGWDARSNINRVLRSWRSLDDPSPGKFTYGVERHELAQSFVRENGVPKLRSDPWKTQNDMEEGSGNLTYATYSITATKEEATYFFNITNQTFFSILRLTYSGELNRSTWIPEPQQTWKRVGLVLPHDTCGSYNPCGANGLCDTNKSPICDCIHGFKPKDKEAWSLRYWADGCVRKTALNCSKDGFEQLRKMKLPDITEAIVDKTIGLKECKEKCLENCNCTGYANTDMQNGGSGCVIWVGKFLDLRKNIFAGQDLFIRLAATDISEADAKKETRQLSSKVIILIAGIGTLVSLGVIVLSFFLWKRKKRMPKRVIAAAAPPPPPPIGGLQCAPMELVNVAKATENFSDRNKIGQGGFGIVYKGILLDGQAIAAKRLLKKSAQAIEGFVNEVKLIASVQHINLVQLVGYCFEGDEMILLFEYLENSSLDTYNFDKTQSYKLDWEKRFAITNGIARGLLYLHEDSRYRIIHRDMKPSNILLDKDMVPKIADFGMAMLFQRDEAEASTTKPVGTFGYMAPEYVKDNIYSVKSDIFSFGVLVLEIISGKRNNAGFFHLNEETLLSYIWRHWKDGKGLEMVDPVIVDSSSTFRPHEVLRCMHIGLLCVQESAEDRPAMSSVILMLTSEKTEMNPPEQPGSFVTTSRFEIGSSSKPNQEIWTVPDVDNWTLSAR